MRRGALLLQAGLLAAAGLALFLYKTLALGFPVTPGAAAEAWTVQARFTVDARTGPVKATLQIPSHPPGFTILDENFISRGYGVTVIDDDGGGRAAQWAIRSAAGRQTLYYRAVVTAGGDAAPVAPPPTPRPPSLEEPFRTATLTLVDRVREHSADAGSFAAELLRQLADPVPGQDVALLLSADRSAARRAQIAVGALAMVDIPARVDYALELVEEQHHALFVPWLEIWDGRRWLLFDPASGGSGRPEHLFVWWRGEAPLIEVLGASNPEVEISARQDLIGRLEAAERRAELRHSHVVEFSLLGLPIQTQSVYGVLLLIPVGAFVMVLLRNVVGLDTFGTFMPILIALAFRETRLGWGILLFTLVVALGLVVRFYLERLRLLLAPRLASVLILVLLILVSVSVLSHRLGLETGLSVALFPIVILTMSIERMSITWEERGPLEALREGFGTLVVAALAYTVMNLDLVRHLVFVFPELLLVLLAATILVGRYGGYRLLELVRFRELAGD